ncbi:uncharacterized protein LOC142567798 isoform X2 [Dermacentor variabilis]|uniref:uncharacterized protein LOC142567798 isoform X2 n=1 Tax=Dermacentor variabilis TaxID=34621 RepID=UPI003F5BA521
MPTDTKNDARAKFQHLSGHEGPPLLTHALLPAVIMLLMPNVVVCTVCFVVSHSSSTTKALEFGFSKFWHESWASQGFAALETWAFIVAFTVYSGLSLLLIHGSTYHGPPTSSGYRPVYRKSGFTYYVITMTIAACVLIVVDAPCQVAYRCMPGLAAALALFAFAIPLLLYAKGRMSPSPGEHGTTGRLVLDFYWGMELYPRIGERLDIKQWTNCRFGMMMWQLLVLVGWKAQIEASGWNWCVASTALLQTIYIAKFFWWEDGYMQTIDITVDRAALRRPGVVSFIEASKTTSPANLCSVMTGPPPRLERLLPLLGMRRLHEYDVSVNQFLHGREHSREQARCGNRDVYRGGYNDRAQLLDRLPETNGTIDAGEMHSVGVAAEANTGDLLRRKWKSQEQPSTGLGFLVT